MSPDDRIRKKYDLSPPSGTFTARRSSAILSGSRDRPTRAATVDTATGRVKIGSKRRSARSDMNSSSDATSTPFGAQPVRPQRK